MARLSTQIYVSKKAGVRMNEIKDIPLEKIVEFPKHPYKVLDDDKMAELVESIRKYGLLQPVLVRPLLNSDKYEMISGHRRKRAFEIAGIKKIPCRIMNLTKDEATILMVDSNIVREKLLPSEKGKAYRMRMEASKRQGKRTDLTSSPTAKKLNTVKDFSAAVGESKDNIYRYIRLTYLTDELLDLVDEGKIKMRPAVEISYLTEVEQRCLFDSIGENDATPSHSQAIRMRKLSEEGTLTAETIGSIMQELKPNQKEKPPFSDSRITNRIPKNIPPEKQVDFVIAAIDYYKKVLQRRREHGAR